MNRTLSFGAIVVLGLIGYFGISQYQQNSKRADDANALIQIMDQRNHLMNDEIRELQLKITTARTYEEGYRDAVVKAGGGNYHDGYEAAMAELGTGSYTDGYHNAIRQFALQVNSREMKSLNAPADRTYENEVKPASVETK